MTDVVNQESCSPARIVVGCLFLRPTLPDLLDEFQCVDLSPWKS